MDIFDQLAQGQSSSNDSSSGDIFDQLASKQPSRGRSLASAPVKGIVKGTQDLVSASNPLGALLGNGDLNQIQKFALEKLLPTQDRPLEKGLERGGRLAVSAVGGPESLALKGARVAGGAALGQIAEEAGLPEWAQGLAEMLAFAAPKLGKNLIPKKTQQEAVKFLRNQGLSDKEIVPLIRSDTFMNRFLSNISAKGKKAKEVATSIKNKLGKGYDILKETGKDKFLRGNDSVQFSDQLSDVVDKINPRFTRLIEKDLDTLRNKGFSQKNLIDFYQDITDTVGKVEGGKAVLNIFKKPIIEGMKKIDPEAATKFTKLNEFYSKGKQFARSIKPTIVEKILNGSKAVQFIGGIVALNFGFLPKLLAFHGVQHLSKAITQNPRLQNLTLQMAESVSKNKIPVALRTFKIFEKELRKSNPSVADALVENLKQENVSKSD